MKLRNRINLYTTVLIILLLIVINSSIYTAFNHMMQNGELEQTKAEAEQAIMGVNSSVSTIPIDTILRAYVPVNGLMQIVQQDGTRDMAVTAPEQQSLLELPVEFYQKETQKIIDYNGIPHALISIPIVWHTGDIVELQVIENLNSMSEMLGTLQAILFIVTVLATIPVIISSRLLSDFISRPITSMIGTMKDIRASGQFKRIPLPKESKDELYQMGETFNSMMDLLEVNYEKQGQFISNASHELKTPLTVIESYASLLKRRGKDQPELFDEAVQAIHSEAIRMRDLTQQLLVLAKHDEQWNVNLDDFEITNVVEELVQSFKKAFQREVTLKHGEGPVLIHADEQKVKQLLYIIMDNARKYSEDDIEIVISNDERTASVEIRDRGIGIPRDEIDRVYERFYRVDKARARKTGGFGLGLSFAKELAEVMKAKIYIDSMEGYGTKVKIVVPLAASH